MIIPDFRKQKFAGHAKDKKTTGGVANGLGYPQIYEIRLSDTQSNGGRKAP